MGRNIVMSDKSIEQMGLFEIPPRPASSAPAALPPQPANPAPTRASRAPVARNRPATSRAKAATPAKSGKKVPAKATPPTRSGLVPEGDVRLTANIREEIHLRLKLVSVHRRTTIGELIEELVENYLESPYVIKK